MKGFRLKSGDKPPKEGGDNPEVDFHRHKRSNQTHGSTADPEVFRKGGEKPVQLCYIGHVLVENRNGVH